MKSVVGCARSLSIVVSMLCLVVPWTAVSWAQHEPRPVGPGSGDALRAREVDRRGGRYSVRSKHGRELELGSVTADGPEFSRNVDLVGRWAEGPVYDMAAKGHTLYLACGGYLKIIDFSDPSNPVEVSKLTTPSVARALALGADQA